jgi:hypothetical protein
MLQSKLGNKADSILTQRRWEKIRNEFENGLKRTFNDKSGDKQVDLGHGVPDIPAIGLEGGALKVSAYKAQLPKVLTCRRDLKRHVFEPIFKEIVAYVQDQITTVRALGEGSQIKVSHKYVFSRQTVFLVGGFGNNQYLKNYLKRELGSDVDVFQPHAA